MTLREQFNKFWPTFLERHLDPRNRIMHLGGNVWMFTCLLACAVTGNPWLLLLALLGYAPSWIGHIYFERNLPNTLHSPFLSALCDLKMVGLIFAGQLDQEVERLFGSKNPMPGSPILVDAESERLYQEKMRYVISAKIPSHPFSDYWHIFLLKHQSPLNVWIHVIAMIYLYALIALVLFTQNWHWLLLVPLSQMAGLLSHAYFERSHIDFEDAVFSPRAFHSLNKMMWLVLTGQYWSELRAVQERLS